LNNKKILICPLDWGIGHASRCSLIIEEFLKQQFEVLICASGNTAKWLTVEFPRIPIIDLPGYKVQYAEKTPASWAVFRQRKAIFSSILEEQKLITDIANRVKPDFILSDSRPGVAVKGIHSIYLLHQLNIRHPQSFGLGGFLATQKHLPYLLKYQELWIPDCPPPQSLSGKLSFPHPKGMAVSYTGLLSRFGKSEKEIPQGDYYLAILSGPEPQRTIFEKMLIEQAKSFPGKIVLLRGLPDVETKLDVPNNIMYYNYCNSIAFEKLVRGALCIVCRSGYSTIMDMAVIGKRACYVPTPGQTEQEYLGILTAKNGRGILRKQKHFNLSVLLEEQPFLSASFEPLPRGTHLPDLVNKLAAILSH